MGPYLAHPNSEKHTIKGQSNKTKLKYTFCQMQGWRRNMEDSAIYVSDIGDGNALYAVFDGHGGPQVAKLVEKIFLTYLKKCRSYKQGRYVDALDETFKRVDQVIDSRQGQQQLIMIHKKLENSSLIGQQKLSHAVGCTANVVLITPDKYYCANAGDSRSVLCRNGKAIPLSIDNKPDNPSQYKRIKNAGGQIVNGRVNGGLNLSRSFGDFSYKQNKNKPYDQQLIICKPQIKQLSRSLDDQFIFIACDGIWERYVQDSQPLISKIWNQRKSNYDSMTILEKLFNSLLAKETVDQLGCDNMSAILIEFMWVKDFLIY